MFGILIGGFIIHHLFKFGRYAGDILYDIIFKEEWENLKSKQIKNNFKLAG